MITLVDIIQFNPLRPDLASEAIQLQNELIDLIAYTQNLQDGVAPGTSGSETIASAPIAGITGATVYAQLASLAGNIKKTRVSVNDDTAISIPLSDSVGIVLGFTDTSNTQFMVYSRTTATPANITMVLGSNVQNGGTAVLTGTTGPDGSVTVSSGVGFFYFENRLGSTQNVEVIVLGG